VVHRVAAVGRGRVRDRDRVGRARGRHDPPLRQAVVQRGRSGPGQRHDHLGPQPRSGQGGRRTVRRIPRAAEHDAGSRAAARPDRGWHDLGDGRPVNPEPRPRRGGSGARVHGPGPESGALRPCALQLAVHDVARRSDEHRYLDRRRAADSRARARVDARDRSDREESRSGPCRRLCAASDEFERARLAELGRTNRVGVRRGDRCGLRRATSVARPGRSVG